MDLHHGFRLSSPRELDRKEFLYRKLLVSLAADESFQYLRVSTSLVANRNFPGSAGRFRPAWRRRKTMSSKPPKSLVCIARDHKYLLCQSDSRLSLKFVPWSCTLLDVVKLTTAREDGAPIVDPNPLSWAPRSTSASEH